MTLKKIATIFLMLAVLGAAVYLQVRCQWLTALLPVGEEKQIEMHKEAVEKLRQEMLEGKTVIQVSYAGKAEQVSEFATILMDEAFQVDDPDTSDDFDYLHYKFTGANIKMQGIGHLFTITYSITYLETKEQTQEVNSRVKEVLKDMKLKKKSEYEKVRLIHDYIISNSEYDLSSQYNSAYGTLIQHYSACQGYAQLTYKMLTEAGVECRIVTGVSGGGPHAWNIVKVDGKWYFLDCTWDDPVGTNIPKSARYAYFLKGSLNFKDHALDEEFLTDEFKKSYPVEISDYGK